jgi:predicted AAA+ superfamily ATPase
MAITNHERIAKALDLLKDGLQPFVEREMKAQHAQRWFDEVKAAVHEHQANLFSKAGAPKWDAASLLAVLWNQWELVFRKTLGRGERTLVSELRDVRNKWAHQNPFTSDDTYRALDSVGRLLTAVSAAEADAVEKMKMELLRLRYEEQVRSEKRKAAGTAVESQVTGTLKPWREVISPHKDVASGRYQQAEFAADLWQVHLGEGSDEYRKPAEFFRRTYLTESLKRLLTDAVRRLGGSGGDPVVQLQTNFGGGKTHSMLALYHLVSGARAGELAGIDAIMREAGVSKLPVAKPVVIVGNKISPGNPATKPDGTVVRTLWGELAWQLGGKKAFARVKADDEHATSPGDMLRELFNEYGPCLILIDEWVAYARQLHDDPDLPAGSFETQFSFAHALTESAKGARQCLLVISLPASDSIGSPHTQADDIEVGGQRGREALERLRNVIGRVESAWRPASAEEGFEIVRRRLFEPIVEKGHFVARDTVAREFSDLYRAQRAEFPAECREADYEKRIQAAYPIHPEVFDRLYTDWSTLAKFQRTRGVLRLMAAVIHSLWEKGDRNPLIMPGNIPIDDPRVQFELTRYLSDNWVPVIEKDVDGPSALPLRLDAELPNLGKFAATRRVARTIYLGSAPLAGVANRGAEDRRVKLGCVMPGESAAVFGDALRRLSSAATYLYHDGTRYWYSTQATVTKLAEERAEEYRRDPDRVVREIERRLRDDLRAKGDFNAVHVTPGTEVADDYDARLIVLGVGQPYSKEPGSPAEQAARAILANRGPAPRLFKNTLVFLAIDSVRVQDLDEAARRHLAWDSIVADKDQLDLSPHQLKQAEEQRRSADSTVAERLPEAYQWLLVPTQTSPQAEMELQAVRVAGQGPLAVKATKKLRSNEQLLVQYAGTLLRLELDRVPLWRGDHVSIKQLAEDFARYFYLPRLQGSDVLLQAVRDGCGLLTWEHDSFAYADGYDGAAGRYRGLRGGKHVMVSDSGLLVKPEVARRQLDHETAAPPPGTPPVRDPGEGPVTGAGGPGVAVVRPTRYHATVKLDPARAGADASRVGEEVLAHLVGMVGADVQVTLEIAAEAPGGFPEKVVRTVTENGRTLKFTQQGFERDR